MTFIVWLLHGSYPLVGAFLRCGVFQKRDVWRKTIEDGTQRGREKLQVSAWLNVRFGEFARQCGVVRVDRSP